MVGSWAKMLATMVIWRRKIKRKYWLKHPKAVPQKQNLDRNINDSKSHIWNYFIENIISGIQIFYINPHVPADIINFCSSILLEHCLKSFWLYKFFRKHVSVWCQKNHLRCTISWHPISAFLKHFESKCLNISVYLIKKIFVPRM